MLTQKQFQDYAARGYNRIPLVREALADLETPLSTYLKLAARPFSYLLESVQGGEKWGRYSIIGLPCRRRIEVRGKVLREVEHVGETDNVIREENCGDPLQKIREFLRARRVPEIAGMPRFSGGLVGFFGYDTVRHIEPHLGANPRLDPIGAPDILLLVSDEIVVFDNLSGRLYVIVHVDPAGADAHTRGQTRLREIVAGLSRELPRGSFGDGNNGDGDDNSNSDSDGNDDHKNISIESEIRHSFPHADFLAAVKKCREYIYEGDVFQVVISQRMSLPFFAAPLDLYRALRTLNPSPYMYFLDLGDFQIAGASPEILARLEGRRITVRPIAGTRPRGDTDARDAELAAELLSDPKELAEHMMLVDLGRNDVGRVAQTGTVAVTEKLAVEKYSHVMHIVSNVTGELRDGLDAVDVLKAAFPAGTLSGAPKVRAMEIIEELEPDKRGIYSGAIGYVGWNGNLDAAIAIRTALIKDAQVYFQAGGGIVADSVPQNEWEESLAKGRAVLRAVAMTRDGLRP